MGIELPPELAGVAAQAGVAWPEADEEAMARQAQAWRDTATSMSTLATDADTTARSALATVSGDTATAATAEWKTFVEPDSGHLTSIVRDANAAADRLEHAADQVGTAKVEIVRNLVSLAQNQDAAQAAAQSGHPFALAGLDTAVRGTAANVAHIESQLISAVQPTSAVDMATVQNPVNANPGHHLLPGVKMDAVANPTQAVTDTAGQVATGDLPGHGGDTAGQVLTGAGDLARQGTGDASDLVRHGGGVVADSAGQVAPGAGDLARQGAGDASDVVRHGGGAVADTAGQVGPGAGNLVQGAGDTAGQVLQGAGDASDVVRQGGGAVADTAGQMAPGAGNLVQGAGDTAGQVVQGAGGLAQQGAGDAANLVQHAGGAVGSTAGQVGQGAGDLPGHGVGNAVGPGQPGSVLPSPGPGGHNVLPGGGPTILPADPEITGPVPPGNFPSPSGGFPGDVPTPPTGQTAQAGFVGGLEASAAPAAPANLPPAAAAAPPLNPAAPAPAFGGGAPGFTGAPVAPVPPVAGAPAPAPGAAAPAPAGGAPAAQPARPAAYAPAAPIPADRPQEPAPRKQMAGPPGAPPPAKGERNEVLAAFWIHMFPIGHLPVASYRPARQLAPPPPELDYAAGIRFEPADHPQFHLVDTAPRLAEVRAAIAEQEAQPLSYQNYAPPPSANYPPAPPAHPAEAVAAGYPPAAPPAEAPSHPAEAVAAGYPPDAIPTGQPAPEAVPHTRTINPSAGFTADHPTVQNLLENHDPLGGGHERDWDRRYLVRLGSVTAHGISPEGLEYNWPTSEQYPEGGSATGDPEVLEEGTVIDRFGTPDGRVFAADGTPFAQRSLPPAHKDTGYRRYKIKKPLPVWRAVSAAWFGQPGGGVRYRGTHSAAELVALGYLEEIA